MSELNFNKYPFLKELGLAEENLGCYSGYCLIKHIFILKIYF